MVLPLPPEADATVKTRARATVAVRPRDSTTGAASWITTRSVTTTLPSRSCSAVFRAAESLVRSRAFDGLGGMKSLAPLAAIWAAVQVLRRLSDSTMTIFGWALWITASLLRPAPVTSSRPRTITSGSSAAATSMISVGRSSFRTSGAGSSPSATFPSSAARVPTRSTTMTLGWRSAPAEDSMAGSSSAASISSSSSSESQADTSCTSLGSSGATGGVRGVTTAAGGFSISIRRSSS
jgi:hypothetical protein